jgi:hypothetical protein
MNDLIKSSVLVFGHDQYGISGAYLARDISITADQFKKKDHLIIACKIAEEDGFKPLGPELTIEQRETQKLEGYFTVYTNEIIGDTTREVSNRPSLGFITSVIGTRNGKLSMKCVHTNTESNIGDEYESASKSRAMRAGMDTPLLVFNQKDTGAFLYGGLAHLRLIDRASWKTSQEASKSQTQVDSSKNHIPSNFINLEP